MESDNKPFKFSRSFSRCQLTVHVCFHHYITNEVQNISLQTWKSSVDARWKLGAFSWKELIFEKFLLPGHLSFSLEEKQNKKKRERAERSLTINLQFECLLEGRLWTLSYHNSNKKSFNGTGPRGLPCAEPGFMMRFQSYSGGPLKTFSIWTYSKGNTTLSALSKL